MCISIHYCICICVSPAGKLLTVLVGVAGNCSVITASVPVQVDTVDTGGSVSG